MGPGYLRSFAKVAGMAEAAAVAATLTALIAPVATISRLHIAPYYKEEGWIEITASFSRFDPQALMDRLADTWVPAGEAFVWNPEAHFNQGQGMIFGVPGIVWALVETT